MQRRQPRSTRTETLLPYTTRPYLLAPARVEQPLLVGGDDRRLVGDRGRELDLLPLLQLGHQARFGRLQGQVLRAGVLQVGLRDGILDAHQHVARLDDVALMDQNIGQDAALQVLRSEERRVGKECGSTCRSRWTAET